MGYTLPGWVDEILEFIGINFPNVDEDDYREMADSLREFADDFEGKGADAHRAIGRVLSASEGWAKDSLESHWGKVKSGHLDEVPGIAKNFAGGLDLTADIIAGMKRKAEVELGVMAASIGIAVGLSVVTGGLSALIGAAETAAMRQLIKRIIDEAAERIVEEVVAQLTEPVTEKFNKIVEDTLLDIADDALALPPGTGAGAPALPSGSGDGGGHGGGGMQLNSAGGGGGGGKVKIDPDEHDQGADKLSRTGTDMQTNGLRAIDRAKSAHGRAKGKGEVLTQVVDEVAEGALGAAEKVVKRVGKHLGETAPNAMKLQAKRHRDNEQGVVDDLTKIGKGKDGGDGPGGPGGNDGGRPSDVRPGSTNGATDDPHLTGRGTDDRFCENDPVDVASGELLHKQVDVDLPGVLPLRLVRAHLSSYRYGQFFGPSWASTLDERLEVTEDGVIWAREDGSLLRYAELPAPGSKIPVHPVTGKPLPLAHTGTGALGESTYEITDPRTGRVRSFADSPSKSGWFWLRHITDRNGNEIAISRRADGTPTTLNHTGGYVVRVHAENGRCTRLTLDAPDGSLELKSYRFEGGDNVTHVINSSGGALEFDYDGLGRMASWTDRNGSTFRYEYDDQHRVVRTIGPDGYLSSRFVYDRVRRTTRYTDSQGAATVYLFNARHQPVAETDALGNTTQRVWDEHGNVLSRTDPAGHETRYVYDSAHNVTEVHAPDGTVASVTYNDLNLPAEITAADGSVWRQTFDGLGNLTERVAPDSAVTRFAYDSTGAVTAITGAAGMVSRYRNNAAGLPVFYTDPHGHTADLERDALGRPSRMTDALGAVTRLEHSIEGKLTARTLPDGAQEIWRWDGEGNLVEHVNAIGGVTAFGYTHFDKLVSRTTPDGATYAFDHDTELRLTKVTGPTGLTWQYAYSPTGRLVAETDFDGRTQTYTQDVCGRRTSRTTPTGERITYERDPFGRILRRDAAGSVTTYRYDRGGRLLQATDASGAVTVERDPRGRVLSETVDGRTVHYRYDEQGRRVLRTTPTGATTRYGYDAVGRTRQLDLDGYALLFEHDAVGRETARSFGHEDSPVAITSSWDVAGRLVARTAAVPGSTLTSRTYDYRADGHLASVTDDLTGVSREFELDPLGRPLGVSAQDWAESYTYDPIGNQTWAAWPAEAGRSEALGDREYSGTRLFVAGDVHYEYDAAGRTVLRRRKRLSRKPDTWHYEWDALDRLVACTTPDGTRWVYTYDALGRRTTKQRLGGDGETPVEAVYFTWDGTRLAEEHATATGVTTTWEHDGHIPLAQYERKHLTEEEVDSRFFAIATDLAGTPTELFSETGEISWQARATVWGTTGWNRDATAYTPLRHPGQYADPETGLHHNLYRHYDPDAARYNSPDPLGLSPAPNPAAWVINPWSWLDPLGLESCEDEIPKAGRTYEEAKADALRDAGIPEGAEPIDVDEWVSARGPEYAGAKQLLNDDGSPIFYTEETYEHPNGNDMVVFQDHWFGHQKPGEDGYQPPHVHVRPFEDTRNGQIPGCEEHYYYDR
ncbi:DUF6531 domain-containing protein [Streptomyces sp. HNM0574]|uniref:DUF6531 domain-containing protein n=1 Tax=Streptomyces sp. HNM0574 TaxID=2714954 RepID=UPI00146F1F96|nr:DUF6531 domain-containing protein [Streptomyces sp. HNM0574]NLU66988.1 type IV secretion protein Rhs [Streptomyces sp. HNM0574]